MSPRAPRTGRTAENFATGVGWTLVVVGALCAVGGIVSGIGGDGTSDVAIAVLMGLLGVALFVVGVRVTISGRAKQKRAAWLRTNGVVRTARVVDAERTGAEEGDVPVYRLSLELGDPDGPYIATTTRIIAEHELALLLQKEVRVRAHPDNRLEVVIDD